MTKIQPKMSRKRGGAKTTKNAKTKKHDSSPYEDMFFGSIFLGRVPARVRSKTQNKNGGSSPPVDARLSETYF